MAGLIRPRAEREVAAPGRDAVAKDVGDADFISWQCRSTVNMGQIYTFDVTYLPAQSKTDDIDMIDNPAQRLLQRAVVGASSEDARRGERKTKDVLYDAYVLRPYRAAGEPYGPDGAECWFKEVHAEELRQREFDEWKNYMQSQWLEKDALTVKKLEDLEDKLDAVMKELDFPFER